MATLTAEQTSLNQATSTRKAAFASLGLRSLLALAPLAGFGCVNLVAEAGGVMPLFFSPMGLPGWAGAVVHLALLFSLGLSMGLVFDKGRRGADATRWLVALIAAMTIFPFLAAPLDSLTLALIMTGVMLIALAAAIRVARISRLGGWLMVPSLAWIGFGAALGLAVSAAWSPPFALITAQQAAPAAHG